MTVVAVLETLTIVTPLGVRFRDHATGAVIADGLIATLRAAGGGAAITGIVNRQGVFAFSGLPAMREVEHGAGDDAFWAVQTPRDFTLDVRDTLGRFLTARSAVRVPHRLILDLSLFSAPSRPPVEGTATLRGDFFDPLTGVRPAWVVVEATAGGRTVAGIADREGRLMLPIPLPEPQIESSGDTPPPRIARQTFTANLAFRYGRLSPAEPPNLVDALSQPAATAWRNSARTVPIASVTLPFGGELAVATEPPPGQRPASTLLITPAGA